MPSSSPSPPAVARRWPICWPTSRGSGADLAGANVRLWERSSEVGALRSCFVSVTQALAFVSLDRKGEALDVLGSAAPRCREAGAAR